MIHFYSQLFVFINYFILLSPCEVQSEFILCDQIKYIFKAIHDIYPTK